MTETEVFILADQTLNKVVQQIRDDQWEMVMPSGFARRGQDSVTLRQIIAYHAYDDAWVPDMLTGQTIDEIGKTKYDGDLLKDDPRGNFARIVETACAAVRDFKKLDMTVHCSFGDYPAEHYFWQINSFRGLRARDIAKAIGVDDELPAELVQGLWDELEPHAEEWRQIGVFGPRVEVPTDASAQDRLLGLTGRQP